MASRRTPAQAESKQVPDKKGYLRIKKGDIEGKIVPESLGVWQREGWELLETPKEEQPVTEETEGN